MTDAPDARALARSRWALLGGNFAIACGVMAPSGVINDLVDSLQVSAAVAGQWQLVLEPRGTAWKITSYVRAE